MTAIATVLMCTNTYDEYVLRAIKSIQSQDCLEFEFMLIANGVNDDVYASLSKLMMAPNHKIYRTEMSGLTFSLNWGLHLASTKYIIRMDADDICYPDRLIQQIQFMESHPHIVVCGSDYEVIDSDDQPVRLVKMPAEDKQIRAALTWGNPICHPSVILRRDKVLQCGGYSGEKSEDYELWLRLSLDVNHQFANLSAPLIGYREPIVSQARYSRLAYINVFLAQMRMFMCTLKPRWLLGALMTIGKIVIRLGFAR